MSAEERVLELIERGPAAGVDGTELLGLFERLAPVGIEEMLGTWRGGKFESNSPEAEQLQRLRWWGKRFTDREHVEPLLCADQEGRVFAYEEMGAARLREVTFAGTTSAAMVYDRHPIIDHFRRVDPDTVLGLLDSKGTAPGFFFHLRRAEP